MSVFRLVHFLQPSHHFFPLESGFPRFNLSSLSYILADTYFESLIHFASSLRILVPCFQFSCFARSRLYSLLLSLLRSDPTGSRRTEEGRKDESSGQLSTVHHRTRARGNEFKSRGDKDGRSRARGSERSEEPQTETRGEVSNISSEVIEYKYMKYIY